MTREHGDVPDLRLPITVYRDQYENPGRLEARTLADLVDELTTVQVGEKNGRAFIYAKIPDGRRGARQHDPDTKIEVSALVLEFDGGIGTAELRMRLELAGHFAIVHSTHSHMTDTSAVSLDALREWQRVNPTRTVADFLVTERHKRREIVEDAVHIGNRVRARDKKTTKAVYRHRPMPRWRVVIPLERPWAVTAETWAYAVLGYASKKALLADLDPGSREMFRLFFTPRAPAERIVQFEKWCQAGKLLTADELAGFTTFGASISAERQRNVRQARRIFEEDLPPISWPNGFDAQQFYLIGFNRLRLADALAEGEAAAGEMVLNGWKNKPKLGVWCPFSALHTGDDDKPEDCVVANAGDGGDTCMAVCLHSHCDGREWWEFVEAWVRRDILTANLLLKHSSLTLDDLHSPFDDVEGGASSTAAQASPMRDGVNNDAKAQRPPGSRNPTIPKNLLRIATNAQLFRNSRGDSFADIFINGHRETWPIRSKEFKDWLRNCYYAKHKRSVPNNSMQEAIETLDAQARQGLVKEVFLRIALVDGSIWLDLCDPLWRVVKISPSCCCVLSDPDAIPMRFHRSSTMQPLPVPDLSCTSLDTLPPLLNLAADPKGYNKIRGIGWLLGVLMPRGEQALLNITGEKGSGKTSGATILHDVLDSSVAPVRSIPRQEKDIFIAAQNGCVLAFDNVSTITNDVSDALCRLTSGGAVTSRKLYTDATEVVIDGCRPVILNGINEAITRSDLLDRTLPITLQRIEAYKLKEEVRVAFEAEHPRLLGALCNIAASGLAALPGTPKDNLPRLADLGHWIRACERGGLLWPEGMFAKALEDSGDRAAELAIEANPVGTAIRSLLTMPPPIGSFVDLKSCQPTGTWEGTASQLLPILRTFCDQDIVRGSEWPRTPHALSSQITRLRAALERCGIQVTQGTAHMGARRFHFALKSATGR